MRRAKLTMQDAMIITWILHGVIYLSSFVLPAISRQDNTLFGYEMLVLPTGWAGLGLLGFCLLLLGLLPNIWFIWVWVIGLAHLQQPQRQYRWRALIGWGVVLNVLSLLMVVVVIRDSDVQFGIILWQGSMFAMLLQLILISRDSQNRMTTTREGVESNPTS